MKVTPTELSGVVIYEPEIFEDERGSFAEVFSEKHLPVHFVQDNESHSRPGVIRGMHFQKPPHEQAKLVRVATGRIIDVAVDVRENSATFGRWVAVELSAQNRRQMFIPRGFAHGFCVIGGEEATVIYKVDDFYAPECEAGVRWDSIGVDWGIENPIVSEKDAALPRLKFGL